jgi:anaerobic magnesium-protoporphyrin IX monomethyl ester cyclase
VGISALSCEAALLSKVAAVVKEVCGDHRPVVAGGPHATVAREALLDDSAVDFVVYGEGEAALVELLRALDGDGDLGEIAGLCWRRDGRPECNEPRPFEGDLDSLPIPAWDLPDLDAYAKLPNWNGILKGRRYATVSTSRGCPYRCKYCHNYFGKSLRVRTPENVLAEMEILVAEHGVDEIHVVDDVFNFDAKRAMAICVGVRERIPGVAFAFPNGLRADIMTPELIDALAAMGTYRIVYGVESVTPRLQKETRKNLDLDRASTVIEATSKAGIITGGYFMLGLTGETRDEMMRTIDFAVRSNLDSASFFKATPYPGSPFYDEALEAGRIKDEQGYEGSHFYSTVGSHGEVEEDELNELMMLAQRRFYMRPSRIWRGLWKSPRKFAYLRNVIGAMALVLQGVLVSALKDSRRGAEPPGGEHED